ncbi:hypothetical protein E2C01_085582 [Portunus trituberculatus]|uniref:Uncharacterized protein n=1 Tax=Portunus trituberculatus TaxID=210409 RepID=A0A5B7JAW4_PORTR|nr:hypothetical protein [Portunus trituberculatus]
MVGKVAGFRDRGVAPLHRTELSSELPSGSVTPTVVEKATRAAAKQPPHHAAVDPPPRAPKRRQGIPCPSRHRPCCLRGIKQVSLPSKGKGRKSSSRGRSGLPFELGRPAELTGCPVAWLCHEDVGQGAGSVVQSTASPFSCDQLLAPSVFVQ